MDESSRRDRRIIVVTSAICVVLQLMIAPNISIGSCRPNFLLVAVVSVAVLRGPREALIAGAVSGIVLDLCGSAPFGVYLIALSLAGWISGMLVRGLLFESWVMTAVFLTICALASELLVCILMAICGANSSFLQSLYLVMLPSALYDAVFAFVAFPLIRHFLDPAPGNIARPGKLK